MSLKEMIDVIEPKEFPEMLLELVKVDDTNRDLINNYVGQKFTVRVKNPDSTVYSKILKEKNETLMYVRIYGATTAVECESRVYLEDPSDVNAKLSDVGNNIVPTGWLLFDIPAGNSVSYGAMVVVKDNGQVSNIPTQNA
jgi:hypothetical protein